MLFNPLKFFRFSHFSQQSKSHLIVILMGKIKIFEYVCCSKISHIMEAIWPANENTC